MCANCVHTARCATLLAPIWEDRHMRGQIISRGKKTFLLRVSTGRDTNGKRRTFNETFHGTKEAADKRLTAILNQRDTGTFVAPTSLTLDQYLDRWLKDAAKGSL